MQVGRAFLFKKFAHGWQWMQSFDPDGDLGLTPFDEVTEFGAGVSIAGDTLAVLSKIGEYRLHLYERSSSDYWQLVKKVSLDELCPGGANTNTGWRHVACVNQNTFGQCLEDGICLSDSW